MLSDFLFYKALLPASGGGGSGGSPDTGCVCVAWHSGGNYEEVYGFVKLSSHVPRASEMDNAHMAYISQGVSGIAPVTVEEDEGMELIYTQFVEDGPTFAVVYEEGGEIPVGFWIIPFDALSVIDDFWLIWEPKGG